MSETTTSEFYQPYFPHTQKQDEVLNRSQYYHPVAVPDSEYYWWTPDPTLYSVAECATTRYEYHYYYKPFNLGMLM
jgi:hypothetical protein